MTFQEMKTFVFKHHKTMTVKELAEATKRDRANMYKFLEANDLEPKLTRKSPIYRPPVEPKKPFQRPKAVYTNLPSPYGIADELKNNSL